MSVEIRKPELYVGTVELPLPGIGAVRDGSLLGGATRQGAELTSRAARVTRGARHRVAEGVSAVDTEQLRRTAARTIASGGVLAGTATQAVKGAIPVAEEALQAGAHRAAGGVSQARAAAAQGARAAAESSKSAASAGLAAVGTAVIQSWRLMFWSSVVGWLLLYIAVPDPQRRRQLYQRLAALAEQP